MALSSLVLTPSYTTIAHPQQCRGAYLLLSRCYQIFLTAQRPVPALNRGSLGSASKEAARLDLDSVWPIPASGKGNNQVCSAGIRMQLSNGRLNSEVQMHSICIYLKAINNLLGYNCLCNGSYIRQLLRFSHSMSVH